MAVKDIIQKIQDNRASKIQGKQEVKSKLADAEVTKAQADVKMAESLTTPKGSNTKYYVIGGAVLLVVIVIVIVMVNKK